LIADAGFAAYRFSFSWPRLFTDGKTTKNSQGFSFYDRLLDGMLDRGILPFATLYHWDLPQNLADIGGWTNRETCKWFGDYTQAIMQAFGDRLHSVATINEPWCVSWLSHYLGHHAPGLQDLESAARSMHLILVAHSNAIEVMRSFNQENIGIVLNKEYMIPESGEEEDITACKLSDEIYNLWFDEAIFKGQYPANTLKLFDQYMPVGFEDDLPQINQKLDWVGLNYYTRSIIKADKSEKNIGFKAVTGNLPKTDMGWEIFPEGLTKLINRQVRKYSKTTPIHITENGMASQDRIVSESKVVDDNDRITYYRLHLEELKALLDNDIPIKSYFAWSLLDNFEWAFGYEKKFGLVRVDYKTQKRAPKSSYYAFKDALKK
jgi:beta-glucosidase